MVVPYAAIAFRMAIGSSGTRCPTASGVPHAIQAPDRLVGRGADSSYGRANASARCERGHTFCAAEAAGSRIVGSRAAPRDGPAMREPTRLRGRFGA